MISLMGTTQRDNRYTAGYLCKSAAIYRWSFPHQLSKFGYPLILINTSNLARSINGKSSLQVGILKYIH